MSMKIDATIVSQMMNLKQTRLMNGKQSNAQTKPSGFANSLNDVVSADKSPQTTKTFEDMWKSKYSGAKYHAVDASKISQEKWGRNDFPFEKFFANQVDESVLNWQPSGKEPAMADSRVQARLDSTLGQKAIMVPPELEEKMKNDPELAKSVMARVDSFIENHPTRAGRVLSYAIALDENGEIANFRVTGGGGHISGPSEEELRQIAEEQKAKSEKKSKAKKESEQLRAAKKEQQQEWIAKQRAAIKDNAALMVAPGKKDAPGVDLQA